MSQRSTLLILISFLVCVSQAKSALPIIYDAASDDGDPATTIDPATQGWTANYTQLGSDADNDGFLDTGTVGIVSASPELGEAWQITDGISYLYKPTYAFSISNEDAETIYNDGFVFSVRLRAKENNNSLYRGQPQAGGFSLSLPMTTAEGYSSDISRTTFFPCGIGSDNDFIFFEERDASNVISLGQNSANFFHEIKIIKPPATSMVRWYVNGLYGGNYDLESATTSTDGNELVFRGGGPYFDGGGVVDFLSLDLDVFDPNELDPIYVDSGAVAGNDNGSSWSNAFTSLQDALAIATEGVEIWVADGIYYPDEGTNQNDNDSNSTFQLIEGVSLYGGFSGTENLRSERNSDLSTNETILSGDIDQNDGTGGENLSNAFHVVFGDGSSAPITNLTIIDRITITGGYATTIGGAGMYLDRASPTINNVSFQGNHAHSLGGGIYSEYSAPIITNTSFQNNSASYGGGIYTKYSSPSIESSSFLSNTSSQYGGGIYNSSFSSPVINNTSFVSNFAAYSGGGIQNEYESSPTINGSNFRNNGAGSLGGGIRNDNSSPSIADTSFLNNSAGIGGGGIFNGYNSLPTIANASFQNNSARDGGGIYNSWSSPTIRNTQFLNNSAELIGGGICNGFGSSTTITNVTLQGNSAENGGAIHNSSASPTITNASLQGNSADVGGGIFNRSSSPVINNCILWNNSEAGRTDLAGASVANHESSTPSYYFSLVQHWDATTLDTSGSDNLDGNNPLFVQEVDPLITPATGGDLRLLTGSPALNVGSNNLNNEPLDLAGNPRIQNTTINLGAYEGAFTTFAHEGFSNPDADDNNNGQSNYLDYALGADPTLPHDPITQSSLTNGQLAYSSRSNAADVFFEFQRSTSLLSDDWEKMISGIDYSFSNAVTSGSTTTQTLVLSPGLLEEHTALFFRRAFTKTEP